MNDAMKRNERLLDACGGPHVFIRDNHQWSKCAMCGGMLSNYAAKWYGLGKLDVMKLKFGIAK